MSRPERRRGGVVAVRLVILVGVMTALATAATTVFGLGVMTGIAAAGGLVVLYSVPAVFLDWPRFGLSDLVDLIAGIWAAITGFFSSLFE